jgi:hypothetical protein
MNKLAISTLAALVAVAGLTAPALALSSLTTESSSNDNFNEDIVLQQLKQQGINASDLSDWNGVIRATVTFEDGTSTFQYFEIGTLRPVSPTSATGSNTRVLSKQDVGPRHAPVLESLTHAEDD